MAEPQTPSRKTSISSLRVVAYEQTKELPPSLPVATASSPPPAESDAPNGVPSDAPLDSPSTPAKPNPPSDEDLAQSSGLSLSPSSSTARVKKVTFPADEGFSLKASPSLPSIVIDEEESLRPSSRRSERLWSSLRGRKSMDQNIPAVPALPAVPVIKEPFRGITMDIPTGGLEELSGASLETLKFSKRGSLINGPQKSPGLGTTATNSSSSLAASPSRQNTRRIRSANTLRARPSSTATRALSVDEEILSHRVRLMYDKGDENVSESEVNELLNNSDVLWEEASPTTADGVNGGSITELANTPSSAGVEQGSRNGSRRNSFIEREPTELAGGLEDWENIQAGDVDRYGFIIPRRVTGEGTEPTSTPQPLQRVSTSLLLAGASPRRKRTLRRTPSVAPSSRSFSGRSTTRKSTDLSDRPTSSQSLYQTGLTRSGTRLRHAANKLPHNKNRKFVDEAADMLTLPSHIGDENDDDSPYARALKKKEWEREDKWRKMAKAASKGPGASGMSFEFDVKSAKLIERTWKGIPDSWRSTAWYAFLSASAKKRSDSPADNELIERFNELQEEPSPDDVQIDIDVPRTINSHIMFRRRYRGGQRLLFRVLHAMSLYFPETGYVQGMATLAATLLSYYDEEHTFIMLVRLWQLRGLDRLYRSGFSGLMEALDSFEKDWLDGGEVAEKLNELGITPTAYGTRWYLTLFNYSIPFPAQLRVWDVFMLLGDSDEPSRPSISTAGTATSAEGSSSSPIQPHASPFGKSLDVLHATSAALIDGMRDIILESDFENAMKVLTSWVPIKDVELFMRVARAEWKVHSRKKA
ncbi:hypothetical protein AJ80_09230 [Polytolypa hystricis UAMH7299]|uniref:Rab-GAP TBC domain-containing protein n=1 Tax=Polytolypa hystricis (strain UAMH7299) TaxID=1447883 RepID=A0A2B7WTY7_POLH7|nr:hypothetical protein AJ80_09230 [Polytolypa hystricis UAMH7299]